MGRERIINIWFVFRILGNCSKFHTRNLHFVWRPDGNQDTVLAEQVTRVSKRKVIVMQHSLVAAHSFMSAYAVTKWIYILLSYEFCEPVYRPANRLLLSSNFQPGQTQNHSAPARAARWVSCPRFFCSCQVSGAQCIQNSDIRKNDWRVFGRLFCFPNFRKAGKFNDPPKIS